MNFTTTLLEVGEGLGGFLNIIGGPLANFVLLLAIVGGIVAIFMGIATVIKRAVTRNK